MKYVEGSLGELEKVLNSKAANLRGMYKNKKRGGDERGSKTKSILKKKSPFTVLCYFLTSLAVRDVLDEKLLSENAKNQPQE